MLTQEDKQYLSLSNFLVASSHELTEDGEYLYTSTYEVPDAEHARHLGPDMVWSGKGGVLQAQGYHYVDSYTYHAERREVYVDPREEGWL